MFLHFDMTEGSLSTLEMLRQVPSGLGMKINIKRESQLAKDSHKIPPISPLNMTVQARRPTRARCRGPNLHLLMACTVAWRVNWTSELRNLPSPTSSSQIKPVLPLRHGRKNNEKAQIQCKHRKTRAAAAHTIAWKLLWLLNAHFPQQ